MRSAVASQRNNGWSVLPLLLSPSGKLSVTKGTASRRAPSTEPRRKQHARAASSLHSPQNYLPRRCGMSAVLVLPYVWALAKEQPVPPAAHERKPPEPQMACYRKYTEAMLRRYVRMSMEAGKVTSLLGGEMFRAKITSYRV